MITIPIVVPVWSRALFSDRPLPEKIMASPNLRRIRKKSSLRPKVFNKIYLNMDPD